FLRQRSQRRRVDVGRQHLSAFAGERQSRRATDAGAGRGQEAMLALEPRVHAAPPGTGATASMIPAPRKRGQMRVGNRWLLRAIALSTSITLRMPATTAHTAGCAAGNCSAAAPTSTPSSAQTA